MAKTMNLLLVGPLTAAKHSSRNDEENKVFVLRTKVTSLNVNLDFWNLEIWYPSCGIDLLCTANNTCRYKHILINH